MILALLVAMLSFNGYAQVKTEKEINECNKKQSMHIADCCRFASYIKYRHLGLPFFVF